MPGIEIKGQSKIATYRHGGRISKQLGGVGNTQPITGTRRFDQSRGYYQPDMGMRGGAMYNKGGQVKKNKGGRVGKFGGGRTNLLEELGRVEAKPSNRNRRAEIARVHGELNKGYNKGGRVGLKHGGPHYITKKDKELKTSQGQAGLKQKLKEPKTEWIKKKEPKKTYITKKKDYETGEHYNEGGRALRGYGRAYMKGGRAR